MAVAATYFEVARFQMAFVARGIKLQTNKVLNHI